HHHHPKQITIVRKHHPFDGRTLETLSWIHRRGVLYANAILPDGTRTMIPATWTNHATKESATAPPSQMLENHSTATLASIAELLHARSVVAPLLGKIESADTARSTPPAEVRHAASSGLRPNLIRRDKSNPRRLADAGTRATKGGTRCARPAARKD